MLIWQGVLAFELWTGVKAPLDIMREATIKAMSGVTAKADEPDSKTTSHNKTSIALIGFMGAGKSAVSKALARRLNKRLVEMDSLIEKQAGKSIPRIFKEDGEIAFRELEMAVTREVAPKPNQVIACGGGVVLNKINIDRLKKQAVVVYLKASAEVIHQRVARDKLNRPLLNNTGKSQAVTDLLAWREPFYERAADITLDTAKLSIQAISDKIITQLKDYEGFSF
jgi:shikimate kinase